MGSFGLSRILSSPSRVKFQLYFQWLVDSLYNIRSEGCLIVTERSRARPTVGFLPYLSRAFLTSVAFSVLSAGEGKASGHLVSVFGNTSRYLTPPGALGRMGQSSCQSSPG